jgi:nitrite reductase (NADH) small subunit
VLVVSFSARGRQNCVEAAAGAFVYARTDRGSFMLPAACPHRGGPLHLGELDAGGGRLVCPWHGRATSITRWQRRGIPAVRRGNTVTAVCPSARDVRYRRSHRPLSADLDRG